MTFMRTKFGKITMEIICRFKNPSTEIIKSNFKKSIFPPLVHMEIALMNH